MRWSGRAVTRVLLAALIVVTAIDGLATSPVHAQIAPGPRPIPPALDVTLTSTGFVPDRITVVPGQSIVIVNDSGALRTITSGGDGTFDSGPVAIGSRFVLALPTEGSWVAADDATPAHTATITVGRLQLEGDAFTSANFAIPDQSPPDGPVVLHPELALEVTRNRILVAFTDSATVPQANAALEAGGLTIVGGNRDSQVLVTEVADPGSLDPDTVDLAYMQQALDILRSQPGVRTAAYDISLDIERALPRPVSPDPGAIAGTSPWVFAPYYSPDGRILGAGINYGLESARFPQAWNWLDTIRKLSPINSARSSTIVLDEGFDRSHPDLADATLHELCAPDLRCTRNPTGLDSEGTPRSEHGNATAGIIGAAFDRGPPGSPTSQGTVGGDPLSDLHLVPYFTDNSRVASGSISLLSYVAVIDLIMDKKGQPPFPFANLRVINLSAGTFFRTGTSGAPVFQELWGEDRCGPGDDDDATVADADEVWCTPNNKDSYLTEFRAASEVLRPIAPRLAANNVLLVVAAGNDGDIFCATHPFPDPIGGCTDFHRISTRSIDPFGYLESIWTGGVPPWVLVEANIATPDDFETIDYSNVDGTISAPGITITPFVDALGRPTYARIEGTSMAAPYVAAAAGLLSSLTPSWQTVRSLLVDRATDDLPEPSAPRLDVFASLLGLPAAVGIDALLDVNDTSPDGNRRVTRDDRGQPTGQDTALGSTQLRTDDTAPDGTVDMRDFRRYRDAWLDTCSGSLNCPEVGQVSLDGSVFHPKKDTNLDGCFVLQLSLCNNLEGSFSRVDFNGDGMLIEREFPVLLDASGNPTGRGAGSSMTDLDVFQTRFGQGPASDTEGWTAADLDALLISADVELRLDQLWAGGVESAEVTVSTIYGTGPRLTFEPRGPGDVRMYTVPIDPEADTNNSDLIQVRVVATLVGGEDTAIFLSPPIEVKAGQDVVVVPCASQFIVEAEPEEITPGGSALISATLNDCTGRPVANEAIDFEIASGPNGSSISVVEAFTDANGVARTLFTYPEGVNSAAQVVARSYPALDGGERLQNFVDLGAASDLVVHYRFRQTILDYERTATNDWGPGQDDCDSPADAGVSPSLCFTATQEIRNDFFLPGLADFTLGNGELERTGTITPNGTGGATVDESVRVGQQETSGTPDAFDIEGITVTTRIEEWDPATPAVRMTRIYDSPIEISGQVGANQFADLPAVDVPTIDFGITDQRVRVNNLRQWGDGYAVSQAAYTFQRGFTVLPETTNPDLPLPNLYQPLQQIPTDLALVPRADSSNFAWDWDPDAPLEFAGNGDGTYQPVSWCGTRQRLFDTDDPGYWSATDPSIETTNPRNPNEIFAGPYRDPDEQRPERQPGDRAAPQQSGSVTSRFEFVAVVTRAGDPAPDLQFESCTDSEPKPIVGWRPADPVEGQEVEFLDVSSYADGAMGTTWRFGDPTGATSTSPLHRFSDNGTYPVDFTTTDAGGADHDSEVADVVVANAPPTLEILEFGDDGRSIDVRVNDPGLIDRQQLEVRLTSPTPGWPSGGVASYTSPPPDPGSGEASLDPWTHTVRLPDTLAPGVYFVVLSVLDKDGGKASTTFSLAVPAVAPDDGTPAGFSGPMGFRSLGPPPAPIGDHVALAAAPTSPAGQFVAQATGTSLPPTAPVPAFVVDRTEGATGDLFSVRNATHIAGTPAGAIFDPGDGRPEFLLGPNAAVNLAYFEGGERLMSVRAIGETAAAGVGVTINGAAIPADVTYVGMTSAPLGSAADVVAHATRAGGSDLPGAVVRFTLGTESVDAVTDGDGLARAELPVTGAVGPRDLVVAAQPDGAPITISFTVTANSIPIADAGGADAGGGYTIGANAPLDLEGAATDADPGEQATLAFEWDLDGDGSFDDAAGPQPSLSAAQVQQIVCGGMCDAGEVSTVALRVTDAKGGRAVDTATVTTIRDFSLTIDPSSATIVPNANVSFTVGVVSTNGFADPVALTAPGLPPGISATFSPPTVTPDGSSLLNIRADSTFTPQDFDLVVRGTSGTTVREAGTDLSLEFGLIPQCFGAATGRITDQETGAGIAGIGIFGTTTDADGQFTATDISLGDSNAPRTLNVSNLGQDYYPLSPSVGVTLACGTTSTLEVALLRRRFGAIAGTISGIDVDGTPLGPIDGAQYALNARTGPDGRYSFEGLQLGDGNTPRNVGVAASASGFHSTAGSVEISAGSTSTLDLTLRKVCTASVRVRVLDERTGKVVPNAWVDLGSGSQGYETDENGIAIIPTIGLGAPDNRPVVRGIRARTPTDVFPAGTASKNITVGSCGAQVPVDIAIPYPHQSFATVSALVVDGTGAPIENATIRVGTTTYLQNRTGPDGRTTVTHLMGTNVPSTLNTVITAGAPGYLPPFPVPITLREDQTTEATVTLVLRRFGSVEGTVRDRATGVPIEGVRVNGITTGPDGRYRIDNLGLNGYNEPAQVAVSAFDHRTPPLYWTSPVAQVTVRADEVTPVPDLLMIKICEPATVRGRVIDAITRDPIAGATVQVGGLSALTDVDGRFVIAEIPVGNDNANLEYTVRATKEGYLPAQKNATIGCAADVVVDFGRDGDGFGVITGRITDGSGAPVNQARVNTGFGGSAITNGNGEYTISGAPAGEQGAARDWTVDVVPPPASQLESSRATATVRRDETTTVDFMLGALADDPPVAASFALTIDSTPTPITLAGADPTNDPLTFAVVVPPGNGTLSGSVPNLVYTPNAGFAGVDTITYTASDGTNTSAPAVISITVRGVNQTPTARITGDLLVDEGTSARLTGATSSDPDGTIASYAWDDDADGQFDDDTGPETSVRLNDDGVAPIGLRVTDDRGGTHDTTIEVTFRNAPPELELEDPEVSGASIELFGEADDPGNDVLTGTIDLGDGAGARPLTPDEFDEWLYVQHTYAAGGTYQIVVVICDDDGGCSTAETSVTIVGAGNPPPTARITGPSGAAEGGSIELSGATASDPGGAIVGYAWDLDGDGAFDDGTGPVATVSSPDDAVVDVGLLVTDNGGATGTQRRTITFTNVAPTVAPIGAVTIPTGGTIATGGTFEDPGDDEWTATADWGDGSPIEPLTMLGTGFTLGHAYVAPGAYTVTVAVCDDDDGCGSTTFTVSVDVEPPDAVADVGIVKRHDGDLTAGKSASYAIEVTNAGPDVAHDVVVVDTLPDGLTFAGSTSSGWTCTEPTPGTVSCALGGGLAVGPAPLLALEVAVDRLAPVGVDAVVNRASVEAATVDPLDTNDRAEDPTTVLAPAPVSDLAASVTVSKEDLARGEAVRWTIEITNAGPDESGELTVGVAIPSGLTFTGVADGAGSDQPQGFRIRQLAVGWACTPTNGLVCTSAGIPAGGDATLPLMFVVDAAAGRELLGSITVTASSADPDPLNNSIGVRMSVAQPAPPSSQPTSPPTTPPTAVPGPTAGPPSTTPPPSTIGAVPATTIAVELPPAATPSPNPGGGPATSPTGQLPETGSDSTNWIDFGAVFVAAGLLLLMVRRVRRRPSGERPRSGPPSGSPSAA